MNRNLRRASYPPNGALIFLASATLFSFACRTPPTADDPESAYRSFYAAVADGDWYTMLQLLDSRSQACLRKAAERFFAGSGAGEAPLSLYLRQLRAEIVTPLKEINVIEQDQGHALLEMRAGLCDKPETCKTGRVTMLLESRGWRVQLKFAEPLLREQGAVLCEI